MHMKSIVNDHALNTSKANATFPSLRSWSLLQAIKYRQVFHMHFARRNQKPLPRCWNSSLFTTAVKCQFYLAPARHDSLCSWPWTVPLFYGWKERSSLFILVCRYHRGCEVPTSCTCKTLALSNKRTPSAFDQHFKETLTKCLRLAKILLMSNAPATWLLPSGRMLPRELFQRMVRRAWLQVCSATVSRNASVYSSAKRGALVVGKEARLCIRWCCGGAQCLVVELFMWATLFCPGHWIAFPGVNGGLVP